jgi:hypothetical protein
LQGASVGIAGPSVLDYKTITSITPSTATGASAYAGTCISGTDSLIASSAYIRMDDYGFAGAGLWIETSGAVSVTVQGSEEDPNAVAPRTVVAPSAMIWISHTTLAAVTANMYGNWPQNPLWTRLNMVTASTTGYSTFTVGQPGGKYG